MPRIECLRTTIRSGGRDYPIFIGFIQASVLQAIAEAPSFSPGTTHQQIASNILTPPIEEWQRPLDERRTEAIKQLFNNTGKLMPNPVLLCENVTRAPNVVVVQQQSAAGSIPTSLWEVRIPDLHSNVPKPLWILDGQHRINGPATSSQRSNPVPVVLLLNQQALNSYSGPLLAELFAQVTTSAVKLDELHNEWLKFAFGLGEYAVANASHAEYQQAMRAVAELCRMPLLGVGGPNNPFANQVRFKIHLSVRPNPGGFAYSCIELKELFRKYYYRCACPSGTHLDPSELARQFGLAYHELTQVVTAPHNRTVFFGDAEHAQKIIQDAFVAGALTYLLHHGIPQSWADVFRALQFHQTNSDFRAWVRTLSGADQTVSHKLAMSVFTSVFRNRALPVGAANLADFLRGNNARVKLAASHLTSIGRPSRRDREYLDVAGGAKISWTINPRQHVKVSEYTENIGKLVVTDMQSPPGRVVAYQELTTRGMVLDSDRHANPLLLLVSMKNYGGIESAAEVTITW